jgi:hypothetical protein
MKKQPGIRGAPEAWFFALSEDSEGWEGPVASLREAKVAGQKEYAEDKITGHACFFVSMAKRVDPERWLVRVSDIIDALKENCADDDSDIDPDHHLKFAEGAEAALEQALADWSTRYVACTYYELTGEPIRVDLE